MSFFTMIILNTVFTLLFLLLGILTIPYAFVFFALMSVVAIFIALTNIIIEVNTEVNNIDMESSDKPFKEM